MIVSRGWQALFISCPKTGTNSIYEALEGLGWQRYGQFHQRSLPGGTRDYLKIGCVRNPYSRAVSAWWSNMKRQVPPDRTPGTSTRRMWRKVGADDFETFCRWLCEQKFRYLPTQAFKPALYSNQSTWYRGIPIDTFLHTETLQQDFNALPMVPAGVTLGRENSTVQDRKDWREYMTPETVALINQWAAPDFEAFGYERLT